MKYFSVFLLLIFQLACRQNSLPKDRTQEMESDAGILRVLKKWYEADGK